MWARWVGPGLLASRLALSSAIISAVGIGLLVIWRRKSVAEPNYLEAAYFFTLIPLLSPQGWDYVMVLALPAYMILVDRWRDSSLLWRAITLIGFFLTSFAIYDVMRRPLYLYLMAGAHRASVPR